MNAVLKATNATSLEAKIDDFLSQRRIAVAGVSRDNNHHPATNLIYRRLKQTDHEVFAVNPHLQTFEGDRCYRDVQSVPGGVDGVVIVTRPETTAKIARECGAAGIHRVGCISRQRKGRASRQKLSNIALRGSGAASPSRYPRIFAVGRCGTIAPRGHWGRGEFDD